MSHIRFAGDRRRWERHPCTVVAACRPDGEAESWAAWIRDISRCGIKLVTRYPLPAGTAVKVQLGNSLPTPPVTLPVEVIHAYPWTAGRWLIGCRHPRELSEGELRRVLEECLRGAASGQSA